MDTFLGLNEPDVESASAVILPIPYEATTSYGKGTAQGPAAMLKASTYVEIYDEARDRQPAIQDEWGDPETTVSRYCTVEPVTWTEPFGPAMEAIRQRAEALVKPGRILMGIGGEHAITPPLVAAHVAHFPDLHVLQIDAHADLRHSYQGSIYSHASAMARVVELVDNRLTQVGIRSICAEDRQAIRTRRLHTFFAHSLHGKPAPEWIDAVIDTLGSHVYLTVDVDGLDPAVIPATGTPEPGGLSWWDTVALIRRLGERRCIVGADINELSVTGDPEGNRRSAFNVAKLTYQILIAAVDSWR
ncbi:MAG: agmatinase [Synechococcales cyanobacterium]